MTTPYWKLISEYGVKAGERIADLERDLENAKSPRGQFVPGRVTDIINPAEPYILRKQAEAVVPAIMKALNELGNADLTYSGARVFAEEYAQRLRQKADELERNQ